MGKTITSEIVVAYAQCPRKAYLLLYTNEQGSPHEYVRILGQRKVANQNAYLDTFRQKHPNVQPYSIDALKGGSDFLINATLQAGMFEAACGILTKVESPSSLGEYSYEPTIFVGTHRVNKDQKLALFFVSHVLGQIQSTPPVVGRIVVMGPKSRKVKLENSGKTLIPLLEDLQEWTQAASPEPPPLILNKHCPYCQFQRLCQAQAEQEDNLSLLDRVTLKVIRRYEKKGIFTVKQLSYLYKPRRRKKRAKNPPPAVHKLELQALAIRTGKIYLQDLPELTRKPIELFLDIEGIPDEQYNYLIGLLVCEADTCTYHSFWADTREDEAQIWQQFVEKVNQYPDAPIYHYGSYEPRAINKLARRYETDGEGLKSFLVNVNTYIYGKVYFPVRSNRLKDIGMFIGATWTSPDASGLQSLVWRHYWDETRDAQYQDLLVTYNREDCQALKLLTDELSKIKDKADRVSNINFGDRHKPRSIQADNPLHYQFDAILRFAHANYDKKKISFQQNAERHGEEKRKRGGQKGQRVYRRITPKATEIANVPCRRECPKHKGESLRPTDQTVERTIIDLVFTDSGVRKTVIKYVGTKSYCKKCRYYYNPPDITELGCKVFGHKFQAWVAYQRLFLRSPYYIIAQTLEVLFSERISKGTVVRFLQRFADYYSVTEQILVQHILASRFVHVDETEINIWGVTQYVWVFTDGKHVVFKLWESRESTVVHEFLADYDGILISDFYPGYDSVRCRQQKCWIHLIRDINDDLWKAPFDTEFEAFALEVRDLIIPIMEAMQEHGLQKQYLNRFKKQVDEFYEEVIVDKRYRSELALKYQQRFIRYRDSLFTFLEEDDIPWHNNAAEGAVRHLSVQRKISETFFESGAKQYLLLLGIMQTCRFQNKSFLRFLLSEEKDIDQFEDCKPRRNTRPVGLGASSR